MDRRIARNPGPPAGAGRGARGTVPPASWPLADTAEYTAKPTPEIRAQYAALRDATAGWG